MAKYERQLRGDFDSLILTLEREILSGSISATFQDESNLTLDGVRCAVRVFERYSIFGGNRLAANITLLGKEEDLYLSVISSGGSQAMLFKINTYGEKAFTKKITKIVEQWEIQVRQGHRP